MTETMSEHSGTGATPAPSMRAVLILDLADSTALADRLGDQRAAELTRRHDRIARDLIRVHGGQEIDKTDGFLLIFDRAVQAVAFALAYQRRLIELAQLEKTPLAARIGIHVGEILIWKNDESEIARGAKPVEIDGLAKSVAARLMSLAWPGQVLLSAVAYAMAQRAEAELRANGRLPMWKSHGEFRFKGVSDPMQVFETGESGVASFRVPVGADKAQRVLPWWRRPATIAGEVAIALGLGFAVVYMTVKPEPTLAFASRDWVLVGELVNRTGRTLLDDSLDLAFRQGLSQSRYVNVMSRTQVQEALVRMQRDPATTAVDRVVGSELALREQARAVFLPSVADTGGSFRLAVEVVDPTTQGTVWVATENAHEPEDILPAMDKIIEALREKLGESVQAIENNSLPLIQATTGNLEALRTYSLGRKMYEELKMDEARRLFERAAELDPEFAMAHAAVAQMYMPIGRYQDGVPAARRAVALRDRLTQRERIFIEAILASAEDPVRSAALWTEYATLYPDLGTGQNNAGLVLWNDLNRCPEAVPLFDQALNSRDSKRFVAGHYKGYCQLWQGDAAAAEMAFKAGFRINPRPVTYGLSDVYSYLERFADAAEAVKADGSNIGPVFALESYTRQITALAYQGRLAEARQIAQSLQKRASTSGVGGTASRAQIYDAALAVVSEDKIDLRESAAASIALLGPDELPQYPAALHVAMYALLAAREGKIDEAKDWAARVRKAKGTRPNPSLEAILQVVDARAAKTPQQGIALLANGIGEFGFFQTRVAMADLARAAGDTDLELEQLRWIDANRGRAFAEYNSYFTCQALNVLDVNRALRRQAELEPEPELRVQLLKRLRNRWVMADDNLKISLSPTVVQR